MRTPSVIIVHTAWVLVARLAVAGGDLSGSLAPYQVGNGNTQVPTAQTFDTLVSTLLDRALEVHKLQSGTLDGVAHGKASQVVVPAQIGSRPLRAPLVKARGITATMQRPTIGQSLRRDVSGRSSAEISESDTIADIESILGPTTTITTTTREKPQGKTELTMGGMRWAPTAVDKSAGRPTLDSMNTEFKKPRNSSGQRGLKGKVLDGLIAFIRAYRGVVGIRFLVELSTLVGIRADQPPWSGVRLLTDPYLNLFTILGPFSLVAALYVLSAISDYLDSQR